MCGILGVWSTESLPAPETVDRMLGAIRHRGPDSSGAWQDDRAGVLVGNTRLAVRELSAAGSQPMVSRDGRWVLVFNGEIYNNAELRERLDDGGSQSMPWRGSSDTETLLRLIEVSGDVTEASWQAVGMFAFAAWDRKHRHLHLSVDRFGEKPLYYGVVGRCIAFASEVSVFRQLPEFSGEIDRGALTLLLAQSCIPAPACIYRGLRKLEAGRTLCVTEADLAARNLPDPQVYWSAKEVVVASVEARRLTRPPLSIEEAVGQVERVLRRSVRRQMVSDVPLGAFLSGGVDSSTVVGLMQSEAAAMGLPPVKTFTIGFDNPSYDEAAHARRVARHLGTEHHEMQVTARHALDVIPSLPGTYAEPFADSSQIPTYLISSLARRHVTVALSGDGADEMFGGYNRHLFANRMYPRIRRVPLSLRRWLASAACHIAPSRWDSLARLCAPLLPRSMRHVQTGYKVHVAAKILAERSEQELYWQLVTHWQAAEVVQGKHDLSARDRNAWIDGLSLAEQMMAVDVVGYLAGDILQKVDRAGMAVSLETRMPYLDPDVFELAWRIPMDMKIRHGVGKWVLRQVLYRHVPAALVERPKMGFSVPLAEWLRGPLRDWAEALLDPTRLRNEGFMNVEIVRQRWDEHLSGARDWQFHLWDVLTFQAWIDASRESCRAS